jgi:hypothetical protein
MSDFEIYREIGSGPQQRAGPESPDDPSTQISISPAPRQEFVPSEYRFICLPPKPMTWLPKALDFLTGSTGYSL